MVEIANASATTGAVFAAQSVFRKVMDAMARPGQVQTVTPAAHVPQPLSPAAAAVAQTLFDHDTQVWLDAPLAAQNEVASWLRFNTGCALTADRAECAFALIADGAALPQLASFAPGIPDYPDRSTTLIVQLPSLTAGAALTLSGPGIRGKARLAPQGLPEGFVAQLAANRALFPLGVDLLLVAGHDIAALPRTTIVARA